MAGSIREAGRAALLAYSGSHLKRLRVGGVAAPSSAPWHLAVASGAFEKVGLSVEWRDFPADTPSIVHALDARDLDVAVLPTEAVVAEAQRGSRCCAVGTLIGGETTWGVYKLHEEARALPTEEDEGRGMRYALSRWGSGAEMAAVLDAQQRDQLPEGFAWGGSAAHFHSRPFHSARAALDSLIEGHADAAVCELAEVKRLALPREGCFTLQRQYTLPWPSLLVAVRDDDVSENGPEFISMISALEQEAKHLKGVAGAETLRWLYGLTTEDASAWLDANPFCCAAYSAAGPRGTAPLGTAPLPDLQRTLDALSGARLVPPGRPSLGEIGLGGNPPRSAVAISPQT